MASLSLTATVDTLHTRGNLTRDRLSTNIYSHESYKLRAMQRDVNMQKRTIFSSFFLFNNFFKPTSKLQSYIISRYWPLHLFKLWDSRCCTHIHIHKNICDINIDHQFSTRVEFRPFTKKSPVRCSQVYTGGQAALIRCHLNVYLSRIMFTILDI